MVQQEFLDLYLLWVIQLSLDQLSLTAFYLTQTNTTLILFKLFFPAKLSWQTENLREMQEEQFNLETKKDEEIKSLLEQEKDKWRKTGEDEHTLETYNYILT